MKNKSKLKKYFINFEQELFTGVATVIALDGKQWNFYFYKGILLWAEGGSHGYRFWQRHLSLLCPHVSISIFEREKIISNSHTDYYFINTLLNQKIIAREQIKLLIQKRIVTILFDILQIASKQEIKIIQESQSAHKLLKQHFNLTLCQLSNRQLLSIAESRWSIWAGKGLTSCSPNLAPILKPDTKLEQQVSPIIFQNMKRMLNGQNTLRDLAIRMNKNVFDVTCALIPYFFKGYIRLIEIPDLPGVTLPSQNEPKN